MCGCVGRGVRVRTNRNRKWEWKRMFGKEDGDEGGEVIEIEDRIKKKEGMRDGDNV